MHQFGRRRNNTTEINNTFEFLESRKMLSTVSIVDFGAIPDDGLDDSGAIRSAINASRDGDTIFFPAGKFHVASEIDLKGNRAYKGRNNATLIGDPSHHIFDIHQDNIRIAGLTFVGKPIFIDKPGGAMVENLKINNNTFDVEATGPNFNGITFTTGLRNSSITNNTFSPIRGDNGIYGYYWDNLTIANNEFISGNEGIHLVDHAGNGRNLLIEQNYFSHLHRMGIELQGGGIDTIVQDNFYENPDMTPVFNDNNDTFAFSIIADRSKNTIIRRNTSIAPERPDGVGVRIVFEVGGDNTIVEQNYSVGGNHILAANDGVGTTSTLARNNRWSGFLQGANGRGLTLKNNGPNVELDWNINRGRPGRYIRLNADGIIARSTFAGLSLIDPAIGATNELVESLS
jgi:hypothetical protein